MNRPLAVAALLAAGTAAAWVYSEQGQPAGLSAGELDASLASQNWPVHLVRILGDPAHSGLPGWPAEFDATPLATHDFDGDGWAEVVTQGGDGKVYVWSARTGKALAVFRTTHPPSWHIERVLNAPAVAVLEPGAAPSIVVGNHAAYVGRWDFDERNSTKEKFAFRKAWELRLQDYHSSPGMDARPVLADLDGDGTVEILAQTEEKGLYAINADGTVRWKHGWGGGNASPAVGDLDGDGRLEAVFASDGGQVSVFEGRSGKPRWTFNVRDHGVAPGAIPVTPAIAELDGAPPREVLFAARDAHARDEARYGENHVAVFAVREGQLVWVAQPAWAHPLSYTQLIVHDTDNDGRPEVFGMDWNTMGHRPGNWERLGPAHVFALGHDGSERWVRETDAWWSNKDLALGDFDGDGGLELLANGPADHDGLWRLDPATGRAEAHLAFPGWKVMRGPTAVDLRGDDRMQLLVPVAPVDGERRGAVMVVDLGVPFHAPWPGHPPQP